MEESKHVSLDLGQDLVLFACFAPIPYPSINFKISLISMDCDVQPLITFQTSLFFHGQDLPLMGSLVRTLLAIFGTHVAFVLGCGSLCSCFLHQTEPHFASFTDLPHIIRLPSLWTYLQAMVRLLKIDQIVELFVLSYSLR